MVWETCTGWEEGKHSSFRMYCSLSLSRIYQLELNDFRICQSTLFNLIPILHCHSSPNVEGCIFCWDSVETCNFYSFCIQGNQLCVNLLRVWLLECMEGLVRAHFSTNILVFTMDAAVLQHWVPPASSQNQKITRDFSHSLQFFFKPNVYLVIMVEPLLEFQKLFCFVVFFLRVWLKEISSVVLRM